MTVRMSGLLCCFKIRGKTGDTERLYVTHSLACSHLKSKQFMHNFRGFANLLCFLSKTNLWLEGVANLHIMRISLKSDKRNENPSCLSLTGASGATVCCNSSFHWTMFLNITLRNLISFHLIIITFHLVDDLGKAVIQGHSINNGIAFWQAPHSLNKRMIPKQCRYCN